MCVKSDWKEGLLPGGVEIEETTRVGRVDHESRVERIREGGKRRKQRANRAPGAAGFIYDRGRGRVLACRVIGPPPDDAS